MIKINNLTVSIGERKVIDDISFSLNKGRITALVGESGSGKTMTGLSLLDLLPRQAEKLNGEILFKGRNIFDLNAEEIRKIRGNKISMVFQEPFTALNPVMPVGRQIYEAIKAHKNISGRDVGKRVDELLELVNLSFLEGRSYPHELSGGMRQRIMIAMALSCSPEVMIFDEPTTALDVSIQKLILELILKIYRENEFAILFITHDFSIVNMIADEVLVMKEGKIVERGSKDKVLNAPEHEYTQRLIDSIPKIGDKRERLPE